MDELDSGVGPDVWVLPSAIIADVSTRQLKNLAVVGEDEDGNILVWGSLGGEKCSKMFKDGIGELTYDEPE